MLYDFFPLGGEGKRFLTVAYKSVGIKYTDLYFIANKYLQTNIYSNLISQLNTFELRNYLAVIVKNRGDNFTKRIREMNRCGLSILMH